jgi:PelA/Pel-15E family pectate lyase
MRQRALFFVAMLLGTAAIGSAAVRWNDVLKQPSVWYATTEARAVADSVLLYQTESGGWPKNHDMTMPPDAAFLAETKFDHRAPTIDNNATHTQLRFLARVLTATGNPRYRAAVEHGLEYLLAAQYPNGGWPQYYPLIEGYYTHITFNDDAMVGVLEVLRDVGEAREPFAWVDAARRARAAEAVRRGLDCILRCQIVVNGEKTVWCAQHDEVTLAPAPARKYELVSLSGYESVGVVRFLMGVENPSPEIVDAVQAAVKWFGKSKLTGIRIDQPGAPDLPHGHDRVVVADPKAPPLWARFYEIGSNRPFFSGRDSVIRYSLAEIEAERRAGYRWYVNEPEKLLERDFPAWRTRLAAFTTDNAERQVKKKYPRSSRPVEVDAGTLTTKENLTYARVAGRDLQLDVYRPVGREIVPAVLIVHGGGWETGSREMERPLARRLATLGYAAIPVSYRLGEAGRFPAALHDLKAAVRWVRAHAAEQGIDPAHIAMLGGSAGGQLAALLGASNGDAALEGEVGERAGSSTVQAVVDIDGLADFTGQALLDQELAKPNAPSRFLGSYPEHADVWRAASALTHVSKTSAPTLFLNSTAPTPILPGREAMRDKLREMGIASELIIIQDTPHPFWLFEPWFSLVVQEADIFLTRQGLKHS